MQISDIRPAVFEGPTRLGLHSVEGFGKTTLAAYFPKPVFIAPERGFPRDLLVRPSMLPVTTWDDVFAAVEMLTMQPHGFETLVFDTMDWIEPMIHRWVCDRDSGRKTELNKGGHKLVSIEDYGFGKGYIAAQEEMRRLIGALDVMQAKRGMHVVVLMHSLVKTFRNPSGDDFDRWQPKLHDRCARVLIEWCENVLFGYFEVVATKADREPKAKGLSTGRRILGSRHNAMYDGKNRMNLPDTIELGDPRELIPFLLGQRMPGVKVPADAAAAPPAVPPAADAPPPPTTPPPADVSPPGPAPTPTAGTTPALTMPPTNGSAAAAPPPTNGATPSGLSTDVGAAIVAAKKLGDKYQTKVTAWVKRAGDDPVKLQSIVDQVKADIAASASASA